MRALDNGGQLIVPRNVLHNYGTGFTIHASQYDDATCTSMREYNYGQGWYLRFANQHKCVGALLGYVYAITPVRLFQFGWDESVKYAYCPYVESDKPSDGGVYQWSYAMTGEQLEKFLTTMNERLETLTIGCDAARTLFRQSVYDRLERDMLGDKILSVETTEVSFYYSENPGDLYR